MQFLSSSTELGTRWPQPCSAGIPDFRGPKGVWTLEAEEKKRKGAQARRDGKRRKTSLTSSPKSASSTPEPSRAKALGVKAEAHAAVDTTAADVAAAGSASGFETAVPTPTHMALVGLADPDNGGRLTYVVTQNVDGLHTRSGLPRHKLAALHGDVFTEKCDACGAEVVRDYDVGGVGLQPTGNLCAVPGCGGPLHDLVLDWDDALPVADLEASERHIEDADLVLCLGTSLRIEPVGLLPLRAKRFVIVNLQVTPIDNAAALVIRTSVDDVLIAVMDSLGLPIPPPPPSRPRP
jgi:mono-ADP-ribosyltransferase sirtuin 6